MDALIPILCLATGVALPLVLVYLVFRRASRQLSAAGAYREVAHTLGLSVDTRGISLHGVLAGRPLWIGEVMVGHGPDRRTEVQGVIGFRRPLGLGLDIRRRRRGRRVVGQPLGDADLDKRVVAQAAWSAGLQAMLDAGARKALAQLVEAWPDIALTDSQVRVRMPRPLSRAGQLGEAVEVLEMVADTLERARESVPPPPELAAWIEPWGELASRLDLGIVPTLPALRGRLGDHLVEVAPERRGTGYRARLCVLFDPDEDTGLRLHPQQAPDGYSNVGQDIQLGHAAFDAAFVVKGYDPEAVRERLSESARQDLLELLQHGPVTLDDHLLCVGGIVADVDVLADVLRRVERLADAVAPIPATAPRLLDHERRITRQP